MRYKLISPIVTKNPSVNRLEVGKSYHGHLEAYYTEAGPITVAQVYNLNPELFDLIDTVSIKTQIVINLSAQYVELQKHYGFDEDNMASKISDIAERICSKI